MIVPFSNHTQPTTMSSREIAELVQSRHDSVKRTIDRCVEGGAIVQPPLVDEQSQDAMGRPRVTQVYHLDKRSSLIVVAQLCPEYTARIVDRWQELEAQVASPTFHIPQTYAEAMRVAANLAEENDELRQENTQLKARALASDALQAVPLLERAAKSLRSAGVPKRQALQRALDLVHDQTGIQLLPGPTPSEDLTAKIVKFVRNAPRYSADKRFGHVCTQGLMPHSKLLKLVALPASDFAAVVADVIQQGILVSGKYGDFKTYSLNKTTV